MRVALSESPELADKDQSTGEVCNLVKQCVPAESPWSLLGWAVLCWEAFMSAG